MTWLRAALGFLARDAKAGKLSNRERARRTLGDWKVLSELASLRDQAALETLPADERRAIQDFWNDLDSLLIKSRVAPPS